MRIVSLLPSATEIVARLGRENWLVGRSEECDYPVSIRALPVVMRARKSDGGQRSEEIDRRVLETRRRGESLYHLDVPLLQSLAPDLLLTQDLCGVCSVTEAEVQSACAKAGLAPKIVSLTPRTLEDVWHSIETVGQAIQEPARGKKVAQELRSRIGSLGEGPPASRARVEVLEWLDPPMLAGLWTPDIIRAAGGAPVPMRPGEPGVRMQWSDLISTSPDLLVVSPCSFGVERTGHELQRPQIARPLMEMAPRLGTWIADEAYFSRPGPRLADGVDLIRHLLTGDRWTPPMPIRPWSASESIVGVRA
jgi:iron complex transport system substrate-binding protein